MPDPIIASTREEFRSVFHLTFADHPLAGRIANAVLFGELLSDGTVLVFGGYDLVLCHRRRRNKGDEDCYTTVVPRTFVEKVPLDVSGMAGKAVQVRISVNRPFQARLKADRPPRVRFWDLLKSVIWNGRWVQIQVEGEITVDLLPAGEFIPEKRLVDLAGARTDKRDAGEIKSVGEGVLAGEKAKRAAKKKDGEITIELDALADLILEVIRRRQGDTAAGPAGTVSAQGLPAALKDSGGAPPEQGNGGVPAAEPKGSQTINPEMLADLVKKVIRAYEEEKRIKSAAVLPEPEKGAQLMQGLDLSGLPLEKIPSRPGLYRTFTPSNLPPPKPHSSSVSGEQGKAPGWAEICSLLKNIPVYPPGKPTDPKETGSG